MSNIEKLAAKSISIAIIVGGAGTSRTSNMRLLSVILSTILLSLPIASIAETWVERDANAKYKMGLKHADGEGGVQDYEDAVMWYRLAAKLGHAEAQLSLGAMYYNGTGVAQDAKEATRWFLLAAEQGLVEAQYNLAHMYHNGIGVSHDYEEALKWARMAAEQGLPSAQYELGVMYDNGRGVVQNKKEAARWYGRAAEQGHTKAQHNLSVMYDDGESVSHEKKAYFSSASMEMDSEQFSEEALSKLIDKASLLIAEKYIDQGVPIEVSTFLAKYTFLKGWDVLRAKFHSLNCKVLLDYKKKRRLFYTEETKLREVFSEYLNYYRRTLLEDVDEFDLSSAISTIDDSAEGSMSHLVCEKGSPPVF